MTSELPYISDVSIEQTLNGEVHVYAHKDEPVVIHLEDDKTGKVNAETYLAFHIRFLGKNTLQLIHKFTLSFGVFRPLLGT